MIEFQFPKWEKFNFSNKFNWFHFHRTENAAIGFAFLPMQKAPPMIIFVRRNLRLSKSLDLEFTQQQMKA